MGILCVQVSADDQCALCGPLMGTCEFLESTLSKANPQMYKFEQKKFALKRVGSYSLVNHCLSVCVSVNMSIFLSMTYLISTVHSI